MSALYQSFSALEQAAANQDSASCQRVLAVLATQLAQVAADLPSTAPIPQAVSADASVRQQVVEGYAAIASAWQHSVMDNATDMYLDQVSALDPAVGAQLRAEIDDFNFDLAQQLLHDFIQRLQEESL